MAEPISTKPPWRTRSLLRRMGQRDPGRRRQWLARYAIVALSVAALVWLALAIVGQRFGTQGPAFLLYWLHDAVYLRLQGLLWTQFFPHSLIWAIPVVVVVTLIGVEFLTIAGLRPLHRKAVVHLIGTRLDWLLPGRFAQPRLDLDRWTAELGAPDSGKPIFGGFVLRVVRERHTEAWHALREAAMADRPDLRDADIGRVIRPLQLALQLDPSNPRLLLAGLEVASLSPKLPEAANFIHDLNVQIDKMRAAASTQASVLEPIDTALRAAALADTGKRRQALEAIAARISALQSTIGIDANKVPTAVSLAADAVVVSTLASAHSSPLGRSYFELLLTARLSLSPSRLSEAAALAETLIDAEFWAARVEVAAAVPRLTGALADALSGSESVPDLAEAFAWAGARR